MKKRYRTSDGGVYEISDAEVNDFMTDFPDAIEVETYDAEGEEYDISADEVSAFMTDFPGAVKKKGVSGQGSDPLTQSLPVKTVPAKVAAKGAAPVTSTPKGTSKMAAAGDPFAQQQVQPSAITYDPAKVRASVKGAKEGIEKTYEIAREGKRKSWYESWNTQQAYSYIKPSIDYTDQMLSQIKDVQDPEIQSIYNELKNINDQMKNQVGQAWNDNWSEETLSKYVGNLAGMAREKVNEVDRRMAQLQQPTQQQQQAQQTFQKAEVKAPKKQPLPAKTEEQIKEEEQIAAMPQTVGLPTDEEIAAQEEDLTYPEKRESYKKRFESTPWLKARYGDYENFELLNNVDKAIKGGDEESVVGLFDERNTKAKGEVLDATMGKRHKEVNFASIQDVFDQVFDRYSESSRVDPQGEETKSLAGDLRVAEMELNNAYEGLDLDYLESQKTVRPTKAAEDLDKYQILTAKQKAGEDLDDDQKQFLLDTRRESLNAYTTVASSKISKIKETSDVNGYAAGMAELTPLIQEVVGNQDLVKYSSEQQMKLANAAKAPIQEEYGKKRDQLAEYEEQLKNIDFQFEQLDAEYQSGSKNQQQYESDFNQLQSIRNEIYGSYETTYNALEELNKAMETAISPFNNEINNIQDPYNKKVQELNNKISELKRKTNVDDSVLAQLDLLYRDLAIADKGAKTVNAQYAGQFYSEELNKMLQEDRKTGANIFSEGMRGFVNGMSKMVTGAMKLPKAIGLEDSEKFGFVDEWYANAMQIEKQSSGTFGALSGKDVPKSLQLAYDIAGATASIANYSITGGVPLNPLLTSAATTFILSAGDNYQRAVDVGFDTNSAQLFANLMTLSQAGAEMIYRDIEVFDDVVGNTLLRNVMKNGLTWKQAARVAIQNLPKNTAKLTEANLMETFEEGTSMVAENLALNTTNAVAGKKYFDDNLSVEGATDMLITTFASTSLTRLIGSGSKLDPTSRMALFKAVSDKEKVLQNLERTGLNKSKISQIKKDLDEAKLKLSVVEKHSNWKAMNDEQKAYAFDLARQLDELEKAKKSNTENRIVDQAIDQQTEQVREELNEALNNPDAVQEQEQTKSNTFEVLEAVKNGEDYPQKLSKHPNWAKLTDSQKKEIESLSEDLEDKQREILSMFEVGVESSTTVEQRNNIESKIADILNNPTNDKENVEGVSGEVGEGQEPVATEPVAGEGEGQAEAGGVLQTPEQEEVAPELSPEMTKIEEKRAAEIEAFDNDENLTEIDGEQVLLTPEGRITRDTINEKYDKQASFQTEVDKAVAEVKKQQDPAYQAALTEAIAVDPQADTRVHQIAAENILNGATATDAMATAAEQATKEARTEKARRAMEEEGLLTGKEDIQKAFKNITRALRSTGIRVRDPLPPDQFEEERKKAGASDTAEGWFRSKTGEIVFSQKALEEGWGTTIIFHEGTHPILNIVRNTDKKLYDKAVQGLKAAAKAQTVNGKPNPLKAVEQWAQKAAGKKSQEQQDDEFLTETIARIASGEIEINQIPRNAREKFIDAMNKIAKFMGFKRIFFNSPDTEFRRLANQIATTLAKGEKVENIVGKRNVKKYQAKFGSQESTSAIFDGVAAKLATMGIKIGGDKKKKTNFDVGKALKEYYKKSFKSMKIDDFGDKAVDLTSDYAVDEILFALDKFGNSSGKGWYTEDFEKALSTLAQIDPDIQNDPQVREIATIVIAIASNSTDVLTNLTRVIYAVNNYKKTGKIPTDVGSGKGASAIATGVARYNLLLDKFNGDVEKVKQFMQTVGPIKDVRQQLIDLTGKKSFAQVKKDNLATDPEWNDTEVLPGSILIFGPKIGAFYSNLSGLGGTPTIDRWCIRTIYRYRGDMMAKVLPAEMERFKQENGLEGQSDGSVLSLVEAHAKLFNDILAGKGEFKGMSKADRNNALKPYRKGSQIAAKITNVVNEISDGLNEKIGNKAQYSKDFRSFTKKVFEEAQKKIKEQTGQDLQISDIQAILWIYEKELFGAMGVNQRPDSTYSSASQRLVDSIKNGVNTVEDFKNGKAKTDQKSVILEEGPMGDLIPMDAGDYMEGLEDQPDRLNDDNDAQNSVPREDKNAEIDTYLSEQEFFRSTSPFAWAVDAVSRETLENSSIVENEGTYAVVTEDGDIKGVFNPNVAKQREGIEPKKGTLNGLIPKAIAAGGIKLDNFDGRLTELYSKNGFKKVSSVPFNEEYAPEGWIKEQHGTPDVVAMVYDPDNKLDIEFKKFDDYGDMIAYRDSFLDQAREVYQNKPMGDQRIADALGMNDTIQPSDASRGDKSEYVQALDEMGFTEQQIEDWREENKVSQRQVRVPGVQQSAQELSEGKKNVYEHIETVRELQPIKPFTKVPKIPSFLDVVASLKSNQVVEGIVGLTKTISNGMRVGLRLDIPAYDAYDTWVVSLHDGLGDNPAGKKIAYGKTGVIRNVNFVTSSTGSLNIARGKSNKATIARMFGDWVNESPESVQARAEQLMNNPAWVQVGMNPFRHSWFYDKADGMPVVSAEEVIQVGALVLAKNTRKLDLNNEQDRAEFEERFKVKIPTGETVQFSGDGRYDKNDIPDLIERAINGIDADLAKGISLTDAIERNITNQPWYPLVTDKQRKSIQNVIESTYDQEIAAMGQTETQEAAPVADSKTTSLASELADLYYQIRDGRRTERNQAEARRDEILRGNPKLSYIYKNISLINAQLEARGLLTKSTGCP